MRQLPQHRAGRWPRRLRHRPEFAVSGGAFPRGLLLVVQELAALQRVERLVQVPSNVCSVSSKGRLPDFACLTLW